MGRRVPVYVGASRPQRAWATRRLSLTFDDSTVLTVAAPLWRETPGKGAASARSDERRSRIKDRVCAFVVALAAGKDRERITQQGPLEREHRLG